MGFSIVIDADVIDEQFAGISPFNLKKDLKKNPDIDLMKLAEEIEAQIDLGEGRPAYCVLFIAPTDKNINCSKMRLQDKKRLKGSSNGYRVILLVDKILKYAFLLHIYRHGHGEDKNISARDKEKLKTLVKEYANSK